VRKQISAALTLALCAGSALAADLPTMKGPPLPPPPPPTIWTGFYAGLNLGGGWSNSNYDNFDPVLALVAATNPGGCTYWSVYGCSGAPLWSNNSKWTAVPTATGTVVFVPGGAGSDHSGGVVGGGQVGYNYQFGAGSLGAGLGGIVVGAEADFQGTSIGGSVARLPWFGTVRGRAGYLFTPTLLLYGTAGFAYGGVDVWGLSNTRTGWTAGGGVEWMFMPNWSVKAEYLFLDLDSGGATGTFGWNFGNHFHPQINVVRAGVNYHFNWGAPAPVLARY